VNASGCGHLDSDAFARSGTVLRWHGCFGEENGVVLMTLVGLPLAVLVVWVLARLRRAAGTFDLVPGLAGGLLVMVRLPGTP